MNVGVYCVLLACTKTEGEVLSVIGFGLYDESLVLGKVQAGSAEQQNYYDLRGC